MLDSGREYPDIQFVDTDTEALTASLIAAYQSFTGQTLYPADPARLFLLWIADIIIQERVLIDQSAKQNIPRYAEGIYLDAVAEFFKDTRRLSPTAAITTLEFTLSAAQAGAQTVPKGTRVTVDGNITFATSDNLTIAAGNISGDVSAECLTIGAAGNGFVAGQINQIVDVFPYYSKVENITTSAGGTDWETDEAFYIRMRENMEAFSTAGPIGAYIYYARTANQSITDVSANSPSPGVVDIRVLSNGALPPEEIIQLVSDTLNDETIRPLTDLVQVSAPDTVSFDINIEYWISTPNAASAVVIQAAANAAVDNYIAWQTSKMGRDINPSRLEYEIMKAGVKRVVITNPTFTAIANDTVAVLANAPTVTYGGIENE
jgi:phage-related baseplate assembly protein